MKLRLTAAAALTLLAGVAHAQSSVTLFGVVDVAYEHLSGSAYPGTINRMISSANTASRLGFKGVEDLGGGLNASFWLEAGINPQNGSLGTTSTNNLASGISGGGGLTFNRRSTVSLAGNLGEIRLGRDFTPSFWNLTYFDPFGDVGAGQVANLDVALGIANHIQTLVWTTNSVGYLLPNNLGGFYGQVMYAMGGNNSNATAAGLNTSSDGNYTGGRFGYRNGPLNVAIAYGQTKVAAINNYDQGNIGASYNFGPATVMAQYDEEKVGAGGALGIRKNQIYELGVNVPVGPGNIVASYAHDKSDNNVMKANQYAVGYVYNLSKRTAIYGTYAHISNSGTGVALTNSLGTFGAAGTSANGIDIGLRTSF